MEVHTKVRIYPVFSRLLGRCIARSFSLVARFIGSQHTYLGKVLGPAVFGLLVIYCFRNISISGGQHGIPELIATIAIYFLYHWKENMILPIAGGTILYMVLLHLSSV